MRWDGDWLLGWKLIWGRIKLALRGRRLGLIKLVLRGSWGLGWCLVKGMRGLIGRRRFGCDILSRTIRWRDPSLKIFSDAEMICEYLESRVRIAPHSRLSWPCRRSPRFSDRRKWLFCHVPDPGWIKEEKESCSLFFRVNKMLFRVVGGMWEFWLKSLRNLFFHPIISKSIVVIVENHA